MVEKYAPIYLDGGGDPDFEQLDAFLRTHFNARAIYQSDYKAVMEALATKHYYDGSDHRNAHPTCTYCRILKPYIDEVNDPINPELLAIVEVVGNGDGTMNVTLSDGTKRQMTEREYLQWPR
jgi:hypothetical protein